MRVFIYFSPNEQCGGVGGGYAARRFLLLFFPCSADHERDWPPCKVVFFGLATNTLNVRNNNNINNAMLYGVTESPCGLPKSCKEYDSACSIESWHFATMFMVITYSRVWINRVRLPILLVVS